MKFGKVYIEWVRYLKKNGLYARYMYEYSRINEYLNIRDALIKSGEYYSSEDTRKKVRELNHRFLNSRDIIITVDKGDSFTFKNLRDGILNLMWYRNDIFDYSYSRFDWMRQVDNFGEENGYVHRYTHIDPMPYGEMYFDIPAPSYAVTTERIANSTRLANRSRHEDAHVGQWYDRFYNRGRNNNINNNRWRR